MNDHADFDIIAAFREGLLDGPASELVGNHLATCPVCAERGAALAHVAARLASAPAPPMPPELSLRLDEALAAEIAAAGGAIGASVDRSPLAGNGHTGRRPTGPPARVSTTGPASRAVQERSSRPSAAAKSRRRARGRMATALRPLAAAAAVCLVVGGGFLLIHSAQAPTPTSGASGAVRHAQNGSAPPIQNGPAMSRFAGVVAMVGSSTAYRSGELESQAAATLQQYRNRIFPGKTGAITMPMQAPSPALSGCLQRVAPGQRRLIVDNASYDGHKVMVIIVPASGGQPGQVWVVAQGCSATAGEIIAHSQLP